MNSDEMMLWDSIEPELQAIRDEVLSAVREAVLHRTRIARLQQSLSGAEKEVLGLVARGLTAKEIAHQRTTALCTTHTQIKNIRRKLRVPQGTSLRRWLDGSHSAA